MRPVVFELYAVFLSKGTIIAFKIKRHQNLITSRGTVTHMTSKLCQFLIIWVIAWTQMDTRTDRYEDNILLYWFCGMHGKYCINCKVVAWVIIINIRNL